MGVQESTVDCWHETKPDDPLLCQNHTHFVASSTTYSNPNPSDASFATLTVIEVQDLQNK